MEKEYPFYLADDNAYYCKHCGTPESQRHGAKCVFNPFRTVDPSPHTHGGTDAPECTTCEGRQEHSLDYRFWIDGPAVQTPDINWADLKTPEPTPLSLTEMNLAEAKYKDTLCCKHCTHDLGVDCHTVPCHSCANEAMDKWEASQVQQYRIGDVELDKGPVGITTNTTNITVNKIAEKPDMVNHPAHYNAGPKCSCGKTIECIDITRHHSLLRGTAIKYLWRADYKGSKAEDLRKALWYIQKELDTLEDW